MRRALSLLTWFALLWGFWLSLVGTISDAYEWYWGFGAAALGATAAEVVRTLGIVRYRFAPRWLLRAATPLARVVPEFAIVVEALLRQLAAPRRRRGAFRTAPFPSNGAGPDARGRRALVGVAGSISPNTLVLHADPDEPLLLVHDLVPGRLGDEPL